jgi:hypothetical protein
MKALLPSRWKFFSCISLFSMRSTTPDTTLQSRTVIAMRRVTNGRGWAEIEERARSQAEYERQVRRRDYLCILNFILSARLSIACLEFDVPDLNKTSERDY